MTGKTTLLVLEDEPLILLDLEYAALDRNCEVLTCASCEGAMAHINTGVRIDAAILDVSLGGGETCFPVANELTQRKIPYVLHSGDLDRHDERIREIDAELIAKPAAAEKVVAHAIAISHFSDPENKKIAAE